MRTPPSHAAQALTLALTLALAGPAPAQAVPCATLAEALRGIEGYDLTLPPAGPDGDWCVMDGATWRSAVPGMPNISAERLRLRATGTPPTLVEVDIAGLRLAPRLGDTAFDEGLRAIFRLQTADLRLTLAHDPAAGTVSLSEADLRLSGGSAFALDATLKAEALTGAALLAATLTRAELDWRSDGRLFRPVMERAGQALTGAEGGAAVDAARAALAGLLDRLPEAALAGETRAELAALVADLPQGRGRLALRIDAPDGLGAARLALAALAEDPTSPATLERFLAGVTLTADWQPGIAP
jgi:hypothetical protein